MSAINRPPQVRVPHIRTKMTEDDVRELQDFLNNIAQSVYFLWSKVGREQTFTAAETPITSSGPGTPDYAIQALTSASPFGFVTADEGETVIQVIENLQTRLTEVENVLK